MGSVETGGESSERVEANDSDEERDVDEAEAEDSVEEGEAVEEHSEERCGTAAVEGEWAVAVVVRAGAMPNRALLVLAKGWWVASLKSSW